jgi:hypothetical protein
VDLKAIATKAAATGFGIAGNAKETAILHLGKTETYDYDTDKMTESGGSDPTVEGIFYNEAQKQGGPTTNQGVFLIQGVDAPSGVFEADTLTRNGKVWQIDQVEPIPTQAVIKLYIRR